MSPVPFQVELHPEVALFLLYADWNLDEAHSVPSKEVNMPSKMVFLILPAANLDSFLGSVPSASPQGEELFVSGPSSHLEISIDSET